MAIKSKLLFLLIVLVGVASATPLIDFKLVMSGTSIDGTTGTFDTPVLSLQNTTTAGIARISSFSLTIGDTTRNYDLIGGFAGGGATGVDTASYSPDQLQAGARADVVSASFSNFDPNEKFVFKVDIDLDGITNNNLQTNQDFRTVLFNNGAGPNAKITVNFAPSGTNPANTIAGPATKSFFLKDSTPGQNTYEFSPATAVPEPGTLLTFAAGVAAIIISRFRRS